MPKTRFAKISIDNYIYNIESLQKFIGPNTKLMLVVKANAYGHGAPELSKAANGVGIFDFGVATVDEAIELRQHKIEGNILVFGNFKNHDMDKIIEHDLTVTISSKADLRKIKDRKIKAHIKIDTGMSRRGFYYHSIDDLGKITQLIHKIYKKTSIDIKGIYTHFASADTNYDFTSKQIDLFKNLIETLKDNGIDYGHAHAANSAGTLKYKHAHFDMVRVGIASYGVLPFEQSVFKPKPVMSLYGFVIDIKKIKSGDFIGYDRTYRAIRDMTIGVVNLGYADGIFRMLSNKGHVSVNGHISKIVGRISMDTFSIDISDIDVKQGDEVLIFGYDKINNIPVNDVAKLCGTNSYEILCAVKNRVRRIYSFEPNKN